MKIYYIIVLALIFNSCKDSKKEVVIEVNQASEKLNEIDYVVNKQYKIGDVRRYGVMPNESILSNPFSKKNGIETVLDLAEKNKIKMTFPKGYYKDGLYIIGRENINLHFEDAEFAGPINIIEDENNKMSSDIKLTGNLISYYKLFSRYSQDIEIENLHIKSDIEKNISGLRSMGCDIYAGVKYMYIKSLIIEDLGSEQDKDDSFKRTRAALQVHGFNDNPSYIQIRKVQIYSSDRHGVYLTGDNHQIDNIIIGKYGIGNLKNIQGLDDTDIDLEETNQITGVWLNKCNNTTIGAITINTENSKGTYSVWLDEGNIGEPTTIEEVKLIGGDKKLPIYANELSNCVIRKVIKE